MFEDEHAVPQCVPGWGQFSTRLKRGKRETSARRGENAGEYETGKFAHTLEACMYQVKVGERP